MCGCVCVCECVVHGLITFASDFCAGCVIRFFPGDLLTLKKLLSHQDDSVKVC